MKYVKIEQQVELSSAGNKWYISKKDMVSTMSFLYLLYFEKVRYTYEKQNHINFNYNHNAALRHTGAAIICSN